ncbi:hypothetical protein NDU88_007468, partial [Pleurodeles waltl]
MSFISHVSDTASKISQNSILDVDFQLLSANFTFQGPRNWIGHHLAGRESQQKVQVLAEEVFDGPETSKQ